MLNDYKQHRTAQENGHDEKHIHSNRAAIYTFEHMTDKSVTTTTNEERVCQLVITVYTDSKYVCWFLFAPALPLPPLK